MQQKLLIENFINKINETLLIDVRSAIEYNHAHIPNAVHVPIFTDEERATIGTLYKKEGRQIAIKKGLSFFGPKMKDIVEAVEKLNTKNLPITMYCARGGMRSAAMAWLLSLYGFQVQLCIGGYKAYRNWVLQQFEKNYQFELIGGFTGTGKTKLLHNKSNFIDIEALANHKGSAFGGIGMSEQASQEMFENKLANALYEASKKGEPIWLEDESQRLGKNYIPHNLWQQMRKGNLHFTTVDFEDRLKTIIAEYGSLPKKNLEIAIKSIEKRLGGLETKNALQYLTQNNIEACFTILLNYYDKQYIKAMEKRTKLINSINNVERMADSSE